MIKIERPLDGKNVVVQVTAVISADLSMEPIYRVTEAKGIKIDGILWLVQEKMGLLLWWGKDDFLLPLESRGANTFSGGIHKRIDDTWDGQIFISTFGFKSNDLKPKHFFLSLDMDRI